MENIIIDPSTGLVGISSVIKAARPVLRGNNIIRAVRRALFNYSGAQMSKQNINGHMLNMCTLETCIHVLNNINGKGEEWVEWHETFGEAFETSLRERVESVCSVSQAEEVVHEAELETKESLLRRGFADVGIDGSVRIDEATGIASIIDVVNLLCPGNTRDYAKMSLNRLVSKIRMETEQSTRNDTTDTTTQLPLAERIHHIQINGVGQATPCSDAKTIIEIIWLLPTTAALEFKRKSAETICRVLGGDTNLYSEIEQRCARLQSTKAGRTAEQFDQPAAGENAPKRARIGPPVMELASDADYNDFVQTEISNELATRKAEVANRKLDMQMELAAKKRKMDQDQITGELTMALSFKRTFEYLGPLQQREMRDMRDKITDIQHRAYLRSASVANAAC